MQQSMHSLQDKNDKLNQMMQDQLYYDDQKTIERWNYMNEWMRIQNIIDSMIDWNKAGNFKHGDSPNTGVQWVFVTGAN